MWLLDAYWPVGGLAILQHKKITEEGLGTVEIRPLPVGRPEIESASDGFLRPVVEVVSEGRSDLGFRLDCCNQPLIPDDEQILLLRGPEVAGQLDRFFPEDKPLRNPGPGDHLTEQIDEAVHMRAACHGAAQPLISLSYRHLFLTLGSPCLPIVGNRLGGAFVQVLHGAGLIHAATLTDSFLISHGE
jgi:hypothetical protein